MHIGLYNLEPNIVNSAMMQVSTYHKSNNDTVEKYNPFFKSTYDKVYAFSIFNFTPKCYVTKDMICGGSGFDIQVKLPYMIEQCDYDWTLYPSCDFSIVWFSRGCIRSCPWCIVKMKEGLIHPVIPKNLNPKSDYIKVMDNNFFANPMWRDAIEQLKRWGQPVDFQGVDVRILNEKMCDALNSLKLYKRIHIAWDDPLVDLKPKLIEVTRWIKPYKLMAYVLIGFSSTEEQDLHRVETLRSMGIDPFVMAYDKRDKYQRQFGRWVNARQIGKTVSWKNYDASMKKK